MIRADRPSGYARSQYALVHTHAPYDAEVNTAAQTTQEVTSIIKRVLASPPVAPFFARIREQYPILPVPDPPSPQ